MRKLWNGELQGLSEKHGAGFFHERAAGLEQLRDAWLKLRDIVDQGKVRVRGRYTSTYSTSDASLADVVDLTGDVLSTFSQFDVSTGGIRRQPQGSPDVLWRDDQASDDREIDAAIGCAAGEMREAEGYLLIEVERDTLLHNAPLKTTILQRTLDLPKRVPAQSLSEAALRRWWDKLSPEEKSQPLDRVLVPLCKKSHPKHVISRERIRQLAPGRKRGRRAFRGDLTAK